MEYETKPRAWPDVHFGRGPYRFDIANLLISKFNYTTYLEIGCYKKKCFDEIVIQEKICIDPVCKYNANFRPNLVPAFVGTSDEFFEKNKKTFDIIFIDGLHLHEQVKIDIENSLLCLNKNGSILVHDINPLKEIYQYRERCQHTWNGDVWKEWVRLRSVNADLNMFAVDLTPIDHGIGVIRKGHQQLITIPDDLTYNYLEKNRCHVLNLIPPVLIDDFLLAS